MYKNEEIASWALKEAAGWAEAGRTHGSAGRRHKDGPLDPQGQPTYLENRGLLGRVIQQVPTLLDLKHSSRRFHRTPVQRHNPRADLPTSLHQAPEARDSTDVVPRA